MNSFSTDLILQRLPHQISAHLMPGWKSKTKQGNPIIPLAAWIKKSGMCRCILMLLKAVPHAGFLKDQNNFLQKKKLLFFFYISPGFSHTSLWSAYWQTRTTKIKSWFLICTMTLLNVQIPTEKSGGIFSLKSPYKLLAFSPGINVQ